jgi:hypothetical protein
MRVLRLGNSMDVISTVPDEGRVYRLLEGMVEEATGEPCETILHRIEPREAMPAIIDRWVRQLKPDIAILLVNQYWYGFPSAPERMQDMGRIGRMLAQMSWWANTTPWVAHSRVYRWARSVGRRAIGTSYLYEPEQVVASMEACLEVFGAKHPAVPVGLWSEPVSTVHDNDPALEPELRARRERVHGPLKAFCEARGIPYYLHIDPPAPFDWEAFRDSDHMHLNAAGHRWVAEQQLPLTLETWERAKALRAGSPASTGGRAGG